MSSKIKGPDSRWDLNYQNTGILRPLPLPAGPFAEYAPWYRQAMETDVLMGRRGVHGNRAFGRVIGQRIGDFDRGLWIDDDPDKLPDPSFWQSLGMWWDGLDWEDPVTLGYAVVGGVLFIGGVAVSVMSLGTGAGPMVLLGQAVLGGMIAGFGAGFGMTGMATHDFGQAMHSGAIGAVAGGVGGLVGAGSAMLVTAGLAGRTIASAANVAAQASRMGLAGQMAVGLTGGVAGGYAGGFAGGTLGGLAAGQTWGEALQSGGRGAFYGGLIGGALGVGAPVAAATARGAWVGGNQLAVLAYLRATVRTVPRKLNWWGTYRTFRPWTPRMRFSFSGRKYFRMAVSEERLRSGFASLERPPSLAWIPITVIGLRI